MLAETLLFPSWYEIALISADTTSRGIAIAITGMVIVGCALLLISLFLSSLPKILAMVATVWPESDEHHAGPSRAESLAQDEELLLAAIGFVLHHRLQQEDGVQPNTPTAKT